MALWPTSVATNADLYIAVNQLQTTLSGAINNAVTTITLASTTSFPTAGAVTIDNEVIFYTNISGAQLTGCTRGADGTTAASHSSGVPVGATIIAFHHNGLKDEIIAIETSLNLTASRAVATNSSGRVVASTATSTELGYLSGVTSAIQTQLNAAILNPSASAITITPTTNQLILGTTRTVTLNAPTPATSSRVWTIPDITADGTFAALQGTQTFSGDKTFTGKAIHNGNFQLASGGSSLLSSNMDVTGLSSLYYSGSGTTIQGLTGGVQGQIIVFFNRASSADQKVIFKYNGSGSQIFFTPNATDVRIGPLGSCILMYDSAQAGWEILGINGGVQTLGTQTNDSAFAGNVGEYVSSAVAAVSATTTGNYVNITSIALTAGDWDVSGIALATNATTTGPNTVVLSQFSGNTTTDQVAGDNQSYFVASTVFSAGQTVPAWRVSVSSSTTVYLKGQITYSAGSPLWYGRVSARRVR